MKAKEKFSKKLLVEGNDDKHVIWALCEKYKIPETFDVVDCGGIEHLFENIPVRFKESGVTTIGIIIDADVDITIRWNTLKTVLSKTGFTVPNVFPKTGLILQNNDQKVGVWIMPDNKTNGILEDFISFLVPEDDRLLPVVDATLYEIEEKQLNKYSAIHKSKARIHTWLAWQEEPGTPLGLSITKRYLTTDKTTCKNLINWLIELF
jgi:hypothetical protein